MTSKTGDFLLSRRDLLASTAALLAPSLSGSHPASVAQRQALRGPLIVYSEANAVVETISGRVRGYTEAGVHTFKGIPYAATTAGNARFQRARKPESWAGVRDSLQYGPACPQTSGAVADFRQFLFQFDPLARKSEDCLAVNIWTTGLHDNRKRPVMVWLHGGGFTIGSSFDLPSYDGGNLARRGDVVVVSINHRLNVFGFLNLTEFGDRYADSGNLGMLDIVMALEWVRDNIANFGGDPNRVTVFGQSGGGAKVNFLMAMPSAKGLFHRAIAQSATPMITNKRSREFSMKHMAALLAQLKLTAVTVEKLHEIPQDTLVEAFFKTYFELEKQEGTTADNIGPFADGRIVLQQPFDPLAPDISSHVPMLIGNTLNEGSGSMFNPPREQWTGAEMREALFREYGERSNAIADALQRTYPDAKPVEIFGHAAPGLNGLRYRIATLTQASRKASQRAALAYVYTFAWKTTVADGRPRAFHRSDLAFVFDNTDRCAHLTGGTEEARELGATMSQAWINFARTGNPNHKGLPKWTAFTPDRVPTMIFDNRCEVKYDHDRQAREVFQQS